MTDEPNVSRIMVEWFADYLRSWEARHKVLKNDLGAVMGGAVLDPANVLLGGDKHIHDLPSRKQPLADQLLNESGQDCIAGNSHAIR